MANLFRSDSSLSPWSHIFMHLQHQVQNLAMQLDTRNVTKGKMREEKLRVLKEDRMDTFIVLVRKKREKSEIKSPFHG